MYYNFKNLTKTKLIGKLNSLFIEIQKYYKIQKKYWLKPITDIKIDDINYYATIIDWTLVHITKNNIYSYYQCDNRKPLVYIVVITKSNLDLTINADVLAISMNDDIYPNKYRVIIDLFMKHYLLNSKHLPYQYKKICKKYENRKIKYPNGKAYELIDPITENNYNHIKISIKIDISKAYDYKLIKLIVWDTTINSKRTLYMSKVFYENNNNLNVLIYDTIKGGLEKLRLTSRSKINLDDTLLKLSAFLQRLKESPDKPLQLRVLYVLLYK